MFLNAGMSLTEAFILLLASCQITIFYFLVCVNNLSSKLVQKAFNGRSGIFSRLMF